MNGGILIEIVASIPFVVRHKNYDAFEWVRLGPSAGNKQPWRILYLKDQKRMDFFLDRKKLTQNKGYWRIQYLDIGIAMAHFELGCKAKGLSGQWKILNLKDLRYSIPANFEYCVTWQLI